MVQQLYEHLQVWNAYSRVLLLGRTACQPLLP